MRNIKFIPAAAVFIIALCLPTSTVLAKAPQAQTIQTEPTRAERRLAAFHEAFEPTGKSSNCINTRRIRDTRIIDKEHILFRLAHGQYALNKLPRTCHSLRRGKAFAYAPISQRLCSVDTITVLDNDHYTGYRLVGPRCGLGQFRTVRKRPSVEVSAQEAQ